MNRRLLTLFSFALAFLLYANTIPNGYSLDDESVTHGHHATSHGLAALPEIFTTPHMSFAGQVFEYRPITLATFALENELFGDNPHIGHFVNALLYALTAAVLLRYFEALLGEAAMMICFGAVLLFVTHPLHTEVVASLKNREEILVLLFGLTSGLLFLRWFERRRPDDAIAGVMTFVLALMCKVSAAPFAVLVAAGAAFRYPDEARRAAGLAATLVLLSVLYQRLVLTFVPTFTPVLAFVENPLVEESHWLLRIGTALSSLWFYLQKLLVPYPLRFFYGYDAFPVVSVFSLPAVLGLVTHAALALYALRNWRRASAAALGIAWYLVAIAPYSNLFILAKGIVAERSAYVASVGFALAAAAALYHLPSTVSRRAHVSVPRSLALVSIAAVGIVYATLTSNRNLAWADAFTLYATDLPGLERSVMAHQIYARQLRREYAPAPASNERTKHLEHAIALAEQARAVRPEYAEADHLVGAIQLYDLDRPADAWPHLARASDLEMGYTEAHYDALYCSVLLGRFDDGLRFGERLLRKDPDNVQGLFYVSKLHFRAGETGKAFAENARLAHVAPDRDLAYVNYGYFHYERGDTENAVENFERALAIAPNNRPVLNDLISILKERGDTKKLERYSALAARLDEAARASAP